MNFVPDIQLIFISSTLTADFYTSLYKTFGLKNTIWEDYFKKFYFPRNQYAVNILPIILRPKSRGSVRLKSNNPGDAPLGKFKFFKCERCIFFVTLSLFNCFFFSFKNQLLEIDAFWDMQKGGGEFKKLKIC